MSSLARVYGSQNIWEERLKQCVEGVKATELDSSAEPLPPSYARDMEQIAEAGWKHQLLTENQIGTWCKVDGAASRLLDIVQKHFSQPPELSTVKIAQLLGNLLYEMEHCPFLGSQKHKVAHLFLNYLGAHCSQPLIVFRKEDSYSQALQSPLSTAALLAEKMREAVIVEGAFLERCIHTRLTDRYCSPGETKPQLAIHWNDLVKRYIA